MIKKCIPIIALIALVALTGGLWFGLERSEHHEEKIAKEMAEFNMTVFPTPRMVSEFTLLDNNGNEFTQNDFKGHWNVLFFGFTHCNHICPPFMRQLAEFYEMLEFNQNAVIPRVFFVSVDPERDNPERINDYVKSFHEDFQGLTGNKVVVDSFADTLQVLYFTVNEGTDKENIEHSGSFIFIDPNGHWRAISTPPHDIKTLVKEYQWLSLNA